MKNRIEVYDDEGAGRDWRWRKIINGKNKSSSGESFDDKTKAKRAAASESRSLKKELPVVVVEPQ
jgi:hypothetical protein